MFVWKEECGQILKTWVTIMEAKVVSPLSNFCFCHGIFDEVHSCTFTCVMGTSPSLLLASACIWVNKFKTELCVCLSQRLKEKHWMGGKFWSDYTHQSVGDLWLMMYVVLCGIWPSYSLPTLIWCRWKIWTYFIDSETLIWRVIILWLCCKYFDHFCHVGQCSDEYY